MLHGIEILLEGLGIALAAFLLLFFAGTCITALWDVIRTLINAHREQ